MRPTERSRENSGAASNFQTLSQPCSYASLTSPKLRYWAEQMRPYWDESGSGMEVPVHRKIWEWAFIASALNDCDMLNPGAKGLGFGVGKEPLVPLLASLGCRLVATDQAPDSAELAGWSESNQFANDIEALNEKGLCDSAQFKELVTVRTVDMREIPKDLDGFDFTWSSCAFEHLGSIKEGLKFILEQMQCLRIGGIAVHTTEFNVGSNSDTVAAGPTVLFRRRDLQELAVDLSNQGNLVNLDFTLGSAEADLHVDSPPWSGPHLRLKHDGYTITSFGLVIQKGKQRPRSAFSKLKLRLNRR